MVRGIFGRRKLAADECEKRDLTAKDSKDTKKENHHRGLRGHRDDGGLPQISLISQIKSGEAVAKTLSRKHEFTG